MVRAHSSPQKLVLRSRIVLLVAEGMPTVEIAARLGISQPPVAKWRKRFTERGMAGPVDALRSGAPVTIGEDTIRRIVRWHPVRQAAPPSPVTSLTNAEPAPPGRELPADHAHRPPPRNR